MATRYPRGCDLSQVPKAADIAKVDLSTILGVDSSNPMLRQLRIQQGFLKAETLPTELRDVALPPLAGKGDVK